MRAAALLVPAAARAGGFLAVPEPGRSRAAAGARLFGLKAARRHLRRLGRQHFRGGRFSCCPGSVAAESVPRHSRRPVQLLPWFTSAAAASAEAASTAAARSAVSASALAAACCLAVLFQFAAALADLASTAACYTTAASAAFAASAAHLSS